MRAFHIVLLRAGVFELFDGSLKIWSKIRQCFTALRTIYLLTRHACLVVKLKSEKDVEMKFCDGLYLNCNFSEPKLKFIACFSIPSHFWLLLGNRYVQANLYA